MAMYCKSAPRYSTSDWFSNNNSRSIGAEKERSIAQNVKQEARFLCNETNNRTKWDQLDNNNRLADRVDDVRSWKDILDRTLAKVEKEINILSDSKEELENALVSLNLPTEVNIENLAMRVGHRGIDLVNDEVDAELNKEKLLIDQIKRELQKMVDGSLEHLCLLQEVRQLLLVDLQDKNSTIDIDVEQYNLTEASSMIFFKPDPTRVPKGSVTLREWEEQSRMNKEKAEQALDKAKLHREGNAFVLKKTANNLAQQQKAIEFALRKRIHEMEQALDELNWQKQQTEEEMRELEDDIRRQEGAIRAKTNPMKLAQTRLENRTYRPGMELCLDGPYYGLCDEVRQLEVTKKALQEKLYQFQHALSSLEKRLHVINMEIQSKTKALKLDKQCLDSRVKLGNKNTSCSNDYSCQRNLDLTGLNIGKNPIIHY